MAKTNIDTAIEITNLPAVTDAPKVEKDRKPRTPVLMMDKPRIYEVVLPDGVRVQKATRSELGFTHFIYAMKKDGSFRSIRFSCSERRVNADRNRLERTGKYAELFVVPATLVFAPLSGDEAAKMRLTLKERVARKAKAESAPAPTEAGETPSAPAPTEAPSAPEPTPVAEVKGLLAGNGKNKKSKK